MSPIGAAKDAFIQARIYAAFHRLNGIMDFPDIMRQLNYEERTINLTMKDGNLNLYFKITDKGLIDIPPQPSVTATVIYTRLFFLRVVGGQFKVRGRAASANQLLKKAYLTGDLVVRGEKHLRDVGVLTGFHVQLIDGLQEA